MARMVFPVNVGELRCELRLLLIEIYVHGIVVKIQKAFKFKLKPTIDQAIKIDEWSRSAKFVWNKWLGINAGRSAAFCPTGKRIPFINLFDISKSLTDWKRSDCRQFLNDPPRDVLKNTLIQQDRAYKSFFKKTHKFPKFKKPHDTIGLLFSGATCGISNNRIKLAKLDWVVFKKQHDKFKNVISIADSKKLSSYQLANKMIMRNATITKKSGKYWLSIQVEYYIPEPIHPSKKIVGIDVGIARFATLSTGEFIPPINALRTHEKKLARENRKLARQTKQSNGWLKQKQKINKLHTKIANIRNTFIHKHTAKLTRDYKVIVVENIKVSNMSRSAKGDEIAHGKNVRAKSGLNKAILDQGWGEFRRQLEYKQKWAGGIFSKINSCNTSRTCISCGHIDKQNRKTQAIFKCTLCGYSANADYVGAVNVVNRYEPEKLGG